jgi:hypothetical protein
VSTGQFPTFMARLLGGRVSVGLLVLAIGTLILAVGRDLSAIASIGSAVALGIFALSTVSHLIIRRETGARLSILVLALLTTVGTLVAFFFTSLVEEPETIAVLIGILLVSIALDVGWRWAKGRQAAPGDASG